MVCNWAAQRGAELELEALSGGRLRFVDGMLSVPVALGQDAAALAQ